MSIVNDTISSEILNDSSIVEFTYDTLTSKYIGNYKDKKLDSNKLITFYTDDTEKLFIKLYNNLLLSLMKDDKKKKN